MKELELIADKKYELLKDDYVKVGERTAYRIKVLKDFGNVKKGDLGGYIEKEENLSHDRNAWVFENAKVYDSAVIKGPNVSVAGDVKVCGDCHIAAGTTATGDNTLTSYRDFVNFKNPYSYNEYTWVKNSNKIYRNDPGLFLFGASNPNETIEQFRESEKARSFNPELAEKAVKALDAFLEMTEKLSEIK